MNLTEEDIAQFTNYVNEDDNVYIRKEHLRELVKYWSAKCSVLESEKANLKDELLIRCLEKLMT